MIQPKKCKPELGKENHIGPFYLDSMVLASNPPQQYVICENCKKYVGIKVYHKERGYITDW